MHYDAVTVLRALGHGSLEGVGDVLTSEVYHSKADILVITETRLF